MAARYPTFDDIEELVLRARGGDNSAFDELVRRYRPRIYALALHVTGSESDADDVTQEVFLRAYRALGAWEGRSDFFGWLYRIALNRSFTERQNRKRRITASLDDPRVSLGVQVDSGGDPRRAAALRQIYRRLVSAMDALSPELKATVILVCLQGMTHPQAARVLQAPAGTIAWRIHEARRRLRVVMGVPPPPPERHDTPAEGELEARSAPPRGPRQTESGPFDLTSLSNWYH